MKYFPVNEIRSVDIGVPDVPSAELFYTEAWGLQVAARQGSDVFLRAAGNDPYVLALRPREEPSVLHVTFGVAAPTELERIAEAAERSGGAVLQPPEANPGPEGGSAMVLRTPEGFVFRFVDGAAKIAPQTEAGPRRAHPVRLSHVNLNCANIEATREFLERRLGFALTDRSATMAFLRCNHDHHAVVLAEAGVDGLNHIAFLMSGFDSLMRASGRMRDRGYPIGWGVGRHGPGDNIFAYFVDPFGIVIEYTAEVLQVDDSYLPRGPEHWKWPPGRTDQWGVAPPKAESVKRAQLAIRFAEYKP